jgi:Polyketide cyclase / dehydrase and lipid transport
MNHPLQKNVMKSAFLALLATSCSLIASIPALAADADWPALSKGEIVVKKIDGSADAQAVQAKILVNKPVDATWKVIINPTKLASHESKVKRAQVIKRNLDGQNVDYSVSMTRLLPTFNYVLEQDFSAPNKMAFHRLSGSFRDIQGSWLLTPAPAGKGTIVTYNLKMDVGPLVPKGMVMGAVKSDLPNFMRNAKLSIEE